MRAVLLDLFDTLVDLHFDRLPKSEDGRPPSTLAPLHAELARRGHTVDFESFQQTLRESDRDLSESHYAQGLELPTRLRFARLAERLGLVDAELPDVLTGTHMGLLKSVSEVPSHHRDVVAALAGSHALALCSNFSHAETAEEILAAAGLLEHFSALVISERVGVRKPRREIFAYALEHLGVEPHEAVHVGDRLDDDVAGAAALGMQTVWLTRRVRDPEAALASHAGARPTWVITDLRELGPLLTRR